MEQKRQIRKAVLTLRDSLCDREREGAARLLTARILEHPWFSRCEYFLCYVSYGSEISTKELIAEALRMGKAVYAPRVLQEASEPRMEFYRIFSEEELLAGYKGIREPTGQTQRYEYSPERAERTLLLMPGVAFDGSRNRIGYGKGFYDRYLKERSRLQETAIGVGYTCQLVERIPLEENDVRPALTMLVSAEAVRKEQRMMEGGEMSLETMGQAAQAAKPFLQRMTTEDKNRALRYAADMLVAREEEILAANERDMEAARRNGMNQGLQDRLRLSSERIGAMAEGLREVALLPDPVGEVMEEYERPNGLRIQKTRVPMGVIGIIYEARPNVTADAFGLCFKTGNAVILKGGSDALFSNEAVVRVLREALRDCGGCCDAVQLITDTDRAVTVEFMKLKEYVDVLIPRGSAGLIASVVKNSTIPVIETGTGNCHVYVDKAADLDMAVKIVYNAKTQRIGVCNACESLVVHSDIREAFLPKLAKALAEKKVELRGDERVREILPECIPATEEDYATEYLDYILSLKTVSSVEEAIAHVNRYSTRHSECIVTEDAQAAEQFMNEVDAACVYWNASTRFTDGFEFGFGAEIGISTQKLHARGPMGLKELTSYKYTIRGNGQVRA